MADSKLSALLIGTTPDFLYGIEGGVSKGYHGSGVINVKDYGAKGDGSTPDTAAIQAAFDAAFGPWTAPHTRGNALLNKPVFFPPGQYQVASPTTNISNAIRSTTIQITMSDSSSWNTGLPISTVVASVGGVPNANGTWLVGHPSFSVLDLPGTTFAGAWTSGGTANGVALASPGAVQSAAVRLTVGSTTGFTTGDFVSVSGIVGTTEANGLFQITVIDGTHIDLQGTTFAHTYTSGGVVTGYAIRCAKVAGGRIYGSGSFSTIINNTVANGITFGCNGMEFSAIEGISFQGAGGVGSMAVDFNWDNSTGSALNAVRFEDCFFQAPSGIAFGIGARGFMGSELVFINCYWANCSVGMISFNSNVLDISILGGGAFACELNAFRIQQGSFGYIADVGFAVNGTSGAVDAADIACFQNGINVITGVRTESTNFLYSTTGLFHVDNCSSQTISSGFFCNCGSGKVTLTCCVAYISKILGGANYQIENCDFEVFARNFPFSVTNVTNNGSGLVRVTYTNLFSPTEPYATDDWVNISGVTGTVAAAVNGDWAITRINAGVFDLQGSSFSGSYTSGGTIIPAQDAYLRDDQHNSANTGAIAASGYRVCRQISRTINYNLPRVLSDSCYDNLGAAGEVQFILPRINSADYRGVIFSFYVAAAQTLKIVATNSCTIRNAGSVSASNGNIAASTIGNFIEIQSVSATQWAVKTIIGTWTLT